MSLTYLDPSCRSRAAFVAPGAFVRAGVVALVLATAGLVTGCPFHKQSGATGTDGTVKADSGGTAHSVGGGWSTKPRGLIDGLFDRTPGENAASDEHPSRKSQQPLIDVLRNAYGPGRQGYEEPMSVPRAPRATRSTVLHAPRPSRNF
jgi:hypothetical protein